MLVKQARAKVEHRLTADARKWLDHDSTELSVALYKRGHWVFYCAFGMLYITIQQMPVGEDSDVVLMYLDGRPAISGVTKHADARR